MSHWQRSPRRVGLALEQVRDRLEPQTLLAEVQRRWRDVVGASIAEQALPTAERGGILTVSCSASVWAHELDLMGPAIVERLNSMLCEGRISRLRCVALPPPG